MSPFQWGHGNSSGFINVNQMDFTMNFYNNAGFRMWSHDSTSSAITSIVADFQTAAFPNPKPMMLFQYIQPDDLQAYSSLIPYSYPYFEIIRHLTDFPSVLSGVQQIYTSNSLQLSTIPRRTYIYLRPQNNTLLASANNTDTYFSIEKIDLQFMNVNGIFSSATQQQLYEMAVNNHIDMDWNSWSGQPLQAPGSFADPTYRGAGSIVCFEYGKDVALPAEYSQGVNGQYTFQIQVTATNRNPAAIIPSLYVVHVYEGVFTITKLGSASKQLGVVSKSDVLSAAQNPFIDYKDVEDVNGGNFLSGLKDFGQKLFRGLKESKAISKGLKALGAIPSPYTQLAAQFAPAVESLGLGEDGEGVLVGGRHLSRAALKSRLRY
jgi:hypothetical protein